MHGLAVADDCGVAAALAPIAPKLHRQAGERIGDRRGIIGALGRRFVGEQVKLPCCAMLI
jgi:hypothetical protein